MFKKFVHHLRKKLLLVLFIGFVLGLLVTIYSNKALEYTSTNESCEVCHVHPHVFDSWKLSTHYDNPAGFRVGCVDCHLPPKGQGYLKEKMIAAARDVYGLVFKDSADFNWEQKSTLEYAKHHVFKESCLHCHQNLFPLTLSKEGQDAHLYYSQNEEELRCINCHLNVGHFDPNAIHAANVDFGMGSDENLEVFTEPAAVSAHESFTETIPNTTISFNMKAIPGGSFKIGSPADEQMRDADEGPQKEVKISPFFMAEIEVTWKEYLAFYEKTAAEGRSTDTEGARTEDDVDAISGPTPPYGQPDQNWGMGVRPAITMSFHAAETYCKWLSKVTGKTYRLPTEAEWEYAARAGSETPYFFEGQPKDFGEKGFIGSLFGKESDIINQYVIYEKNGMGRTQEPDMVEANPFGLKNMLGNALEYCSDWYAEDAFTQLADGAVDPKGPATGEEHVVKGGSFRSPAGDVRSAWRDYTRTVDWLRTDPQMPKSIWWLSDCNYIGFRVICEFDENTGKIN
ncbi:Formylglycine-generating enzyme, required for sulfatase activity, contains SUMF1/FGE domain [Mariniphaga anaerophila]|uniref:Formylglycine-generating enzyme, required for sulfatase activity, contains SUMF1/FGE domain n=1 Tax=Mariniphaga anaerophila TaxID=1484053 RepID=A0A1M5BY00_9BACT|nr:SUMF1/EgtB/PvdO family nonheme iron enzyme [Mariniphaga anaerophila]SHF47414.1 Formylglycine-generating enzyme, required for sulfatase activity, contains SUMF1/FGE domain [Mariniphaga anaerophila]